MIYDAPGAEDLVDQGDLLDGCPVVRIDTYLFDEAGRFELAYERHRVVVVTQTCDLANGKTSSAVVAEVFDAQYIVGRGLLKPADIRHEVRKGRVWGWYFLPADAALGLPEMVIDLRRLHTLRLDLAPRPVPGRAPPGAGPAAVPRTPRQALRRHVQPDRPAGALRDDVTRLRPVKPKPCAEAGTTE